MKKPGILAFFLSIVGLVFGCSSSPPSSDFLDRQVCTHWAGYCQEYATTVRDIQQTCEKQGSASWVAGGNSPILRCKLVDGLTRKTTEISLSFESFQKAASGSPPIEGDIQSRNIGTDDLVSSLAFGEETTTLTIWRLAEICKERSGKATLNNGMNGAQRGFTFQCEGAAQDGEKLAAVVGVAVNGVRLTDGEIVNIVSQFRPQDRRPANSNITRAFFRKTECELGPRCPLKLVSWTSKGNSIEQSEQQLRDVVYAWIGKSRR